MCHKVIVTIVTLGVTVLKTCAAEPHVNGKWQRPSLMQDYNGFLIGIDQRLRSLDSIRHTVSRTEVSIQTLSTRMDLIETRLQTVQGSLQHTIDAVSTAVKSSEMKYELLLEQLSRKVEAGFDRINHRLNTLESRSEATINKLQNDIDLHFGRVVNKQNTLGNELLKIGSNTDLIRADVSKHEERNNRTLQILVGHFQEIHVEHSMKKEHLKNITNLLSDLQSNKSEGFTQNDAPILPVESLKMIKAEIIDEGHKTSAKIHNMYNDLWKTVKDLEILIRNGFEETNNTNRELYKTLSEKLSEEQSTSENFMDVVLHGVLTNVGDHIRDLQRQVDNKFKEFKTSQEKHGESCHKIKNLIEHRVALILEKIYDAFDNRTERFSKQILEIAEQLKAHNKQLIEATTETSNLIVALGHDNSEDHKELDNTIKLASTKYSDACEELEKQAEDIDEIFLENQRTLTDIKHLVISMREKEPISNSLVRMREKEPISNSSKKFSENLHAIEANFSNGVINIKTNLSSINPTGQSSVHTLPLEALNKSISTTELVAVIGEPRNEDEGDEIKRNLEEDDDGFDAQEETGEEEWKPVDTTQLLLAYIKVLHGNLTPNEFLAEAVPGNSYETFNDMIKHLRKAGNVPRETIHDIEQLAFEQNFKDSLKTHRILQEETERDSEGEDVIYDEEE